MQAALQNAAGQLAPSTPIHIAPGRPCWSAEGRAGGRNSKPTEGPATSLCATEASSLHRDLADMW